MKKPTSLKRHLFLTKNFILMLVMLVLIIVAISAWFSFHKTVDANNITVKAVSTEIDIADCVKNYNVPNKPGYDSSKPDYSLLSDGPGEFKSNITIPGATLSKDCTGDGVDLIVPEFNVTKDYDSVRTHGGKEVNVNADASPAKSNKQVEHEQLMNPDSEPSEYQYIEYEFYARSKNKELLLQDDSQLLASVEPGVDLKDDPGVGNKKRSAYGAFSVDGLVGAMRVSLIGEACYRVDQSWTPISGNEGKIDSTNALRRSAVKQLLWVARPDVKLNVSQTPGDITNWTVATGVTSNQYEGETYKHQYYRSTANNGVELVTIDPLNDNPVKDPKAVVSTGTSNGIKSLGSNVNISDFSSYSPENQPQTLSLVVDHTDIRVESEYYVTKYTLRIWIEGTDSEARRAMDGGQFKLTLNLL